MSEKEVIVKRGNGMPLGVHRIGKGQWQFSVAMKRGKEISLELFHPGAKSCSSSIVLGKEYAVGGILSVMITVQADITEYCYRVNGKHMLDPYAVQLTGREQFGEEREEDDVHCLITENIRQISEPLYTPFHELILYRLHVRGFTKHSSSRVKHPGTFRGIEEKIPYMKQLGINGVVLLPCYEFDERMNEEELGKYSSNFLDYTKPITKQQKEEQEWPKVNFWGYTKRSNYFAPKASYASNPFQAVNEMKQMIKKLHENGISVFMEMFFSPGTNQSLILDCLRYWVRVFAVDGFKLNTEVANGTLLASDPFLSRTKFLATYWNTGEFFQQYEKIEEKTLAEYNDGFMVDCRRFLKSDEGQINGFVNRMRRNPNQQTVVNYITNTNGFTLMDLVSYDIKHNEANGEQGLDGTEYNYSWNCGWEGPTRKKQITQLRLRQIKNALSFLFLAQGVPMLLAGDEFGNTQKGNNNAYCQDNEIGWVTWNKQVMNQRILAFCKKIIALRKTHPVFSPKEELRGMDYIACGSPDISFHGTKPWYPDLSNYSRVIGIMLCGKYAPISIRRSDKSFYMAFNMHWEPHQFELPILPKGKKWRVIIDTYKWNMDFEKNEQQKGKKGNSKETETLFLQYMVNPRTVVIFEEE
ncbi:MAG: alpha amylase C-terminal domain-containing protein [Lachnospiraceae bacterium]|nr:alpha amylase C-terminal domain-containing protein [Lachnospiraceae bacterium]